MVNLNEIYQTADWKTEKHVPAIDIEKGDKNVKIKVAVGKEIAHPNTPEHHIRWIDVYFLPKDGKFALHVGRSEFNVHGDSATKPAVSFVLNTEKSGTVLATSYCNIHGLWRNSVEI